MFVLTKMAGKFSSTDGIFDHLNSKRLNLFSTVRKFFSTEKFKKNKFKYFQRIYINISI